MTPVSVWRVAKGLTARLRRRTRPAPPSSADVPLLEPGGGVERPWSDVLADISARANGRVVLAGPHPLTSRRLVDAVRSGRALNASVWIRPAGDELVPALASELRALGHVGIEEQLELSVAEGDPPAHLSARMRTLASALSAGLPARAWLALPPVLSAEVERALERAEEVSSELQLTEAPGHDEASRARVLETLLARPRRRPLFFEGFSLDAPAATAARLSASPSLLRFARMGLRHPAAEAGLHAPKSLTELAPAGTGAGGVRELGLTLAAWGAPVLDFPACLGGRGRGAGTRVARCEGCPAVRCAGVMPELESALAPALGPRAGWKGAGRGSRVSIVEPPNDDKLLTRHTLPRLVRELGIQGSVVRVVRAGAERDFVRASRRVVCFDFETALHLLDEGSLGADAELELCDFHLLQGFSRVRARFEAGWPDERLRVTSCFPRFAHVYANAGVPLTRLSFRPYPHADAPIRRTSTYAFTGGMHLRDWETLEQAALRLDVKRTGPIRVRHPDEVRVRALGPLRPRGRCSLRRFERELSRARFVILPLHFDRERTCGGMVLASALAHGRPVIATRAPMTLDHLRDGIDSLLLPAGDPQALAGAILQLAEDHELRAKLAAGARRSGARLSTQAWAREIVHGALPDPDGNW